MNAYLAAFFGRRPFFVKFSRNLMMSCDTFWGLDFYGLGPVRQAEIAIA